MPVERIPLSTVRGRSARQDELVGRLVAEWRGEDAPVPAPIIQEMTDTLDRTVHIYVVWDEWKDLRQGIRSEIIMDAFEIVRGPKKALEVSVAMGVTHAEAQKMGSPLRFP
jgi:hypothetical protein